MPKATRAIDGTTPKKRSRKNPAEAGNGTQPENGNGVQAAPPITTPEFAHAPQTSPVVEEKIRARAYELYVQRGGVGGSAEQDWLRAKEEVCGQRRSASASG
jgi:Protein of unknown function (DUF2934)